VSAARRLVLLRHGRTALNHEKRIQGQLEVELDDTGHAQAQAVAPAIATLGPVVLWASDSLRARQTASYVVAATGLEPTFDARLREFFLAERQGITHAEYAGLAPAEFAEFRRGHYDVVPGGEKTVEVVARMREATAALVGLLAPGETGLAVTHGAAIRALVADVVGGDLDGFHGVDNCAWVELRQEAEGEPLRLVAYNRVVRVEGAGTDDAVTGS
jgi:probable phosphoglycerate mutase